MIRVLIQLPVRAYRDTLSATLAHREGIELTASVASVEAALDQLSDPRPDVVLADASTPAGIEAIGALARARPPVKVVACAVPDDDATVVACVEAGASGLVAQDAAVADLIRAIKAAVRGEAACSARVTATLLRQVGASVSIRRSRERGRSPRLTDRERQILALIDDGLSNKEIAGRLFIELSTVKNHVHNILEKLGARRRSEAAARARRTVAY